MLIIFWIWFLGCSSISGFSKIVGLEIRVCSAKKKKRRKDANSRNGVYIRRLSSIFTLSFRILQIFYIHHHTDHPSSKSHPSSFFPVLFSSQLENWNLFYTQLCLLISGQLKNIFYFDFKSIWFNIVLYFHWKILLFSEVSFG